jgi:hypothetical protein
MLSSRHTAELDEHGYTLIPCFAPTALLAELRATVARLYEIEGETAGSEFRQEPGCLRLANLVDKGAIFQRVVADPAMLALVRHVIGEDFKLSSLNGRTALPGCAPQPLHADMGGVADERGAWVCNLIWMLDAYTPDNGPVRVVPGSHRWRRLPASELPDLRSSHPAEIAITAPAGSVVVMNAHTWHGGLDNRTSGQRTALHAFYCRGDKPQQQYQKKLLRPAVQSSLSPDLRLLLALDDPRNDELAASEVPRSGFLPAPTPERPRAF